MHRKLALIDLCSVQRAGAALAAMVLTACIMVRSNCGEKNLPTEEESAVREFMILNGLENDYNPNRLASQADVEGCPTGHIQQITASGIGIDTIPPSIAFLGHLQLLMVDNNKLRSLPRELTALHSLKVFVDGNLLCEVDSEVAAWLTLHQPGWDTSQTCL